MAPTNAELHALAAELAIEAVKLRSNGHTLRALSEDAYKRAAEVKTRSDRLYAHLDEEARS